MQTANMSSRSTESFNCDPQTFKLALDTLRSALRKRISLPVKNLIGYIHTSPAHIRAIAGHNEAELESFVKGLPNVFEVTEPNNTVTMRGITNERVRIYKILGKMSFFGKLLHQNDQDVYIPSDSYKSKAVEHSGWKVGDVIVVVYGYGRDPRELHADTSQHVVAQWCATEAEDLAVSGILSDNLPAILQSLRDMFRDKGPLTLGSLFDHIHKSKSFVKDILNQVTDRELEDFILSMPDVFEVMEPDKVVFPRVIKNCRAVICQIKSPHTFASMCEKPEELLYFSDRVKNKNLCSQTQLKEGLVIVVEGYGKHRGEFRDFVMDSIPQWEVTKFTIDSLSHTQTDSKQSTKEVAPRDPELSAKDTGNCTLQRASFGTMVNIMRETINTHGPQKLSNLVKYIEKSLALTYKCPAKEELSQLIASASNVFDMQQPSGHITLRTINNCKAKVTYICYPGPSLFARLCDLVPAEDVFVPVSVAKDATHFKNKIKEEDVIFVDAFGKDPREFSTPTSFRAKWRATRITLAYMSNTKEKFNSYGKPISNQFSHFQANIEPVEKKPTLRTLRDAVRSENVLTMQYLAEKVHAKHEEVREMVLKCHNVFELNATTDVVSLRCKKGVCAVVQKICGTHCYASLTDIPTENVFLSHDIIAPTDNSDLSSFIEIGQTVVVDIEGQDKEDYSTEFEEKPNWKAVNIVFEASDMRKNRVTSRTPAKSDHLTPGEAMNNSGLLGNFTEHDIKSDPRNRDSMISSETIQPIQNSENHPGGILKKESIASAFTCAGFSTKPENFTQLMNTLRQSIREKSPMSLFELHKSTKMHKDLLMGCCDTIEDLQALILDVPTIFDLRQPGNMVHLREIKDTCAIVYKTLPTCTYASVRGMPNQDIYISVQCEAKYLGHSRILKNGQEIYVDAYGKDCREYLETKEKTFHWHATRVSINDAFSPRMKTASIKSLSQIIHNPLCVKPTLDTLRDAIKKKGPLTIQKLYGRIHGKNQKEVRDIVLKFSNVFELDNITDIVSLRFKKGVHAVVCQIYDNHCYASLTAETVADVLITSKTIATTSNTNLTQLLRAGQTVLVDIEGQDEADYATNIEIKPKWKAVKASVKTSEKTTMDTQFITQKPKDFDLATIDEVFKNSIEKSGLVVKVPHKLDPLQYKKKCSLDKSRDIKLLSDSCAFNQIPECDTEGSCETESNTSTKSSQTNTNSLGQSSNKSAQICKSCAKPEKFKHILDTLRQIIKEKSPISLFDLHENTKKCKDLPKEHVEKIGDFEAFVMDVPNVFEVRQPGNIVYVREVKDTCAVVNNTPPNCCFASLCSIPDQDIYISSKCEIKCLGSFGVLKKGQKIIVDAYGQDRREYLAMTAKCTQWCATKVSFQGKEEKETKEQIQQSNIELEEKEIKGIRQPASAVVPSTSVEQNVLVKIFSTQTICDFEQQKLLKGIDNNNLTTATESSTDDSALKHDQIYVSKTICKDAVSDIKLNKSSKLDPSGMAVSSNYKSSKVSSSSKREGLKTHCGTDANFISGCSTSAHLKHLHQDLSQDSPKELARQEEELVKDSHPNASYLNDTNSGNTILEHHHEEDSASTSNSESDSENEFKIRLRNLRDTLWSRGPMTLQHLFEFTNGSSVKELERFILSVPNAFHIRQPGSIVMVRDITNEKARIVHKTGTYIFATMAKKSDIYAPVTALQEGLSWDMLSIGDEIIVDGYFQDSREESSGKPSRWRATKVTTAALAFIFTASFTQTACSKGSPLMQTEYDPQKVRTMLECLRNTIRKEGPLPVHRLQGCILGRSEEEVKEIVLQFPKVFSLSEPQSVVGLRILSGVQAVVVCVFKHYCYAVLPGHNYDDVFIPMDSIIESEVTDNLNMRNLIKAGQEITVDVEGQDQADYTKDIQLTPPWKAVQLRVTRKDTVNSLNAETVGLPNSQMTQTDITDSILVWVGTAPQHMVRESRMHMPAVPIPDEMVIVEMNKVMTCHVPCLFSRL